MFKKHVVAVSVNTMSIDTTDLSMSVHTIILSNIEAYRRFFKAVAENSTYCFGVCFFFSQNPTLHFF